MASAAVAATPVAGRMRSLGPATAVRAMEIVSDVVTSVMALMVDPTDDDVAAIGTSKIGISFTVVAIVPVIRSIVRGVIGTAVAPDASIHYEQEDAQQKRPADHFRGLPLHHPTIILWVHINGLVLFDFEIRFLVEDRLVLR
jgi:hypothetical protein